MKKKKLLIALGAVLGVISVCVILCFTLFGLKNVEIQYHSSVTKLAGQEENIIESGQFSYGGCVFFMGKTQSSELIEKAYPYIKVVNIETVFPSKYIIHATERLPVYAVENEAKDKYYITDDEFKVLEIEESFTPGQDKPILYQGLQFEEAEKGDFLSIKNKVDLYSALILNNRFLYEQTSMIKSVEAGSLLDKNIGQNQAFIKLSLYDGQTFLIKNCNYKLENKISYMFAIRAEIFSLIGQKVTQLRVDEDGNAELDEEGNPIYDPVLDEDGEQQFYTREMLSSCTIEITNKYLTEGLTYKIILA